MPPAEIEYFDANGRAAQLRMVSWYCNVPHTDKRIRAPEFAASKKAGKYKFGSLPVLNMHDGSQMGQTQSIMRWIG